MKVDLKRYQKEKGYFIVILYHYLKSKTITEYHISKTFLAKMKATITLQNVKYD